MIIYFKAFQNKDFSNFNSRLSKELGDKDEFVLKWSDHNKTVLSLFHQLWSDNSFTDVTLTTKVLPENRTHNRIS